MVSTAIKAKEHFAGRGFDSHLLHQNLSKLAILCGYRGQTRYLRISEKDTSRMRPKLSKPFPCGE